MPALNQPNFQFLPPGEGIIYSTGNDRIVPAIASEQIPFGRILTLAALGGSLGSASGANPTVRLCTALTDITYAVSRIGSTIEVNRSHLTPTGIPCYADTEPVAAIKEAMVSMLSETNFTAAQYKMVFSRVIANGTGKLELGRIRNDADGVTCKPEPGLEIQSVTPVASNLFICKVLVKL